MFALSGGYLLAFAGTGRAADHWRAAFSAASLLIGTCCGFGQIPNRDLELIADEDLSAVSFAFLGLAGALPLVGDLSGLTAVNDALAVALLLMIICIFTWRRMSKRRAGAPERNAEGSESSGSPAPVLSAVLTVEVVASEAEYRFRASADVEVSATSPTSAGLSPASP